MLQEEDDQHGDGSDEFIEAVGLYHDERWWLFVSVSRTLKL